MDLKSGNDFDAPESVPSNWALRVWLALTGLFGLVFVLCSIAYVWLYIQQVQNGYWLARYYEELEQLNTVQRKLKLEWSRFQDPFLLERMGKEQFGLFPPKAEQKLLMR